MSLRLLFLSCLRLLMLTLTGRDNETLCGQRFEYKGKLWLLHFLYNFTLKYIKKLNIQEISIWH